MPSARHRLANEMSTPLHRIGALIAGRRSVMAGACLGLDRSVRPDAPGRLQNGHDRAAAQQAPTVALASIKRRDRRDAA